MRGDNESLLASPGGLSPRKATSPDGLSPDLNFPCEGFDPNEYDQYGVFEDERKRKQYQDNLNDPATSAQYQEEDEVERKMVNYTGDALAQDRKPSHAEFKNPSRDNCWISCVLQGLFHTLFFWTQ